MKSVSKTRRSLGTLPFLILVGAVLLTADVCLLIRSHHDQRFFAKDVVQFYFMGKAVLTDGDVYAPIPELAKKFDPRLGKHLQHPSAYPPPTIFLGVLLAQFSYGWVVVLWTSVEIVALLLTIVLLIREFGPDKIPVMIIAVLMLGWMPVFGELWWCGIMLTISLLLSGCWLFLRRDRDILAGILLGLVLAFKLYAWPLVLFLMLRRRWGAVTAAILTPICLNLLALLYLDMAQILNYYTRVGPALLPLYVNDLGNFSAWATGFKLMGQPGGILLIMGTLIVAIALELRVHSFDSGYMIMLTVSTVLSPVSWMTYFSTLLPALCLLVSRRLTIPQLLAALVLLVAIAPGYWAPLDRFPLMYAIPFGFVIGFIFLLASVDRKRWNPKTSTL